MHGTTTSTNTTHSPLTLLLIILLMPSLASGFEAYDQYQLQPQPQLHKILWVYLDEGDKLKIQCNYLCQPNNYQITIYEDYHKNIIDSSKLGYIIQHGKYTSKRSNRYIVVIMSMRKQYQFWFQILMKKKVDVMVYVSISIGVGGFFFVLLSCMFCCKPKSNQNASQRTRNNRNNRNNPVQAQIPITSYRQFLPPVPPQPQPEPLPAQNNVPTFNTSQVCCICLDSQCNVAIHCGHYFHYNCIMSWVRRQKNCPHCRTIIQMEELVPNDERNGGRQGNERNNRRRGRDRSI